MAGTVAGGKKCAETNIKKYGEDFYKHIGRLGGKKGRTGGFYHAKYVLGDDEFARKAGMVGGRKSRRGKAE